MKPTVKNILKRSINEFLIASNEEKEKMVIFVQEKLKEHNDSLNSIGIGYKDDIVVAGNIFLRIFGAKN